MISIPRMARDAFQRRDDLMLRRHLQTLTMLRDSLFFASSLDVLE